MATSRWITGRQGAPTRAGGHKVHGTPLGPDEIRAAIAGLPENYRVVVTLRYLGEHSVREVADLLGLPEGTAKIRLFRARALLRDVLEDWL